MRTEIAACSVADPGKLYLVSGIQKKTYFGSRIKKGTGSQFRITSNMEIWQQIRFRQTY
jgi:hypothetical protein